MSKETAENTPFTGRTIGLLTSLLAVLVALGLGAAILGVSGINPLRAYRAILEGSFGNSFAIGQTLTKAAPLAIVAIGAAVALRAGAITIGAQGQLVAGSIGALLTSFLFADAPSAVAIPAAAVGGIIFGTAWVAIPAFLRARMGVNEILSTLLFNEFAFLLLLYLLNGPLGAALSITPKSEQMPENATLGKLIGGTQIHVGVLVVVVVAVLFYVWTRSVMGYRYDLYGENPQMAHSMGMPGKLILFNSLLISGAAAGMAGWMQVAGPLNRVYANIAEDIGFFGLVAAMLGGARPLGILAASLLVGALQAGGLHMQATEEIPANLSHVIEALILLGFAVRYAPQIVSLLGRVIRSVRSLLRLERDPGGHKEFGWRDAGASADGKTPPEGETAEGGRSATEGAASAEQESAEKAGG